MLCFTLTLAAIVSRFSVPPHHTSHPPHHPSLEEADRYCLTTPAAATTPYDYLAIHLSDIESGTESLPAAFTRASYKLVGNRSGQIAAVDSTLKAFTTACNTEDTEACEEARVAALASVSSYIEVKMSNRFSKGRAGVAGVLKAFLQLLGRLKNVPIDCVMDSTHPYKTTCSSPSTVTSDFAASAVFTNFLQVYATKVQDRLKDEQFRHTKHPLTQYGTNLPGLDEETRTTFQVDLTNIAHIAMSNPLCAQAKSCAVVTATEFFEKNLEIISQVLLMNQQDILFAAVDNAFRKEFTPLTVADLTDEDDRADAQKALDQILAEQPWPNVHQSVPEAVNATRRDDSGTLKGGAGLTKWRKADVIMHEFAAGRLELDKGLLIRLNGALNGNAGKIRDEIVGAGGGDTLMRFYLPPTHVEQAIKHWLKWVNEAMATADDLTDTSKRLVRYIHIANDAYAWLVSIHPFHDGNGRTTKMVSDCILMRGGLPPVAWSGEYAMFGGQLLVGWQKADEWKRSTLLKTIDQVLDGVRLWKEHAV